MHTQSNRREFLAAAAALSWAGTRAYAAGASKAGPNEAVNLALIGCGFRGQQLIGSWLSRPGVRIAAVCDVHAARMEQARERIGGQKVAAYQDFRKLLESKDVDAVIIATTDHWHALHALHALQAGKDVYVEKPLATTIHEGRTVVEAAKKYNRVARFGTWQQTMEHYRKAIEIVRSGRLGAISEVKVWDYDNFYPGFGSPPDGDPPKELDWDLYLGPAPKVPYNLNRYRLPAHHLMFDYGCGWETDWGVHHYDIVHRAMDVQSPVAATAMGGKLAFPKDNTQWPDTFNGILQYPAGPVAKSGFFLQYTSRTGCRREQRSHGKWFFGTDGSLLVARGGYWLSSEVRVQREGPPGDPLADAQYWLAGEGRKTMAIAEDSMASKNDPRNVTLFIEHVRNRTKPAADGVEVGHYATIPGHLMNIAWRVGRQIRWDAQKEQIIGDAEAHALLTRKYRAPWALDI